MFMTDTVTGLIASAEVIEIDWPQRKALVRRSTDDSFQEGWAQIAVSSGAELRPGDQVVVAGPLSEEAFVIGCLSPPAPQRLSTSHGVYAELKQNAVGDDTLQVRSAENELLFELDPATGMTHVAIPAGSLNVTAGSGDINFCAAGNVRIEGNTVEVKARHRLAFLISAGVTAAKSWLRMKPGGLQLGSEQVDISAEQLTAISDTTTLTSTKISMAAESHKVTAQRLETIAETSIERSGNLYQTVRELAQTQAGRVRTFVSGLSHFRSKRAYFSSEETFNIDGEKINLG